MQTLKVLTDSTGYNGTPVNPFHRLFSTVNENYYKFEAAHPSLPLTERQDPGVVVECKVVWQYQLRGNFNWEVPISYSKDTFEHWADIMYKLHDAATRQAYQPIAIIKSDEVEKDGNVFVPIICGETCGCKARGNCTIGKGNHLNTPLRIDKNKKLNAITYEQILTLPNNEFSHKYQPGYDNIDGNYNYFGTSPDAMMVISVNADYAGHTSVNIKKDGGTRTVFNGHVRSFEELQLINSLVL